MENYARRDLFAVSLTDENEILSLTRQTNLIAKRARLVVHNIRAPGPREPILMTTLHTLYR